MTHLKNVCEEYAKTYNLEAEWGTGPEFFTTDFEQAAINAVLKIFPNIIIVACFFHLVKHLWEWAAKNGLKARNILDLTRYVINLLKGVILLPRTEEI